MEKMRNSEPGPLKFWRSNTVEYPNQQTQRWISHKKLDEEIDDLVMPERHDSENLPDWLDPNRKHFDILANAKTKGC